MARARTKEQRREWKSKSREVTAGAPGGSVAKGENRQNPKTPKDSETKQRQVEGQSQIMADKKRPPPPTARYRLPPLVSNKQERYTGGVSKKQSKTPAISPAIPRYWTKQVQGDKGQEYERGVQANWKKRSDVKAGQTTTT